MYKYIDETVTIMEGCLENGVGDKFHIVRTLIDLYEKRANNYYRIVLTLFLCITDEAKAMYNKEISELLDGIKHAYRILNKIEPMSKKEIDIKNKLRERLNAMKEHKLFTRPRTFDELEKQYYSFSGTIRR